MNLEDIENRRQLRILKGRAMMEARNGTHRDHNLYRYLRDQHDKITESFFWWTSKNQKRIMELDKHIDYVLDNIVERLMNGIDSRTKK